MIRFTAMPEIHWHRHLGLYIAFGIRAKRDHKQLLYIPDVFCRRRDAAGFVRLCNREQPELPHLRELIEDEL